MNETAEILDRAADALMLRGRSRGSGIDGEAICLVVAITQAVFALYGFVDWRRQADAANAAVERYVGLRPNTCWRWSDETDDDDLVIDTLRRCAKAIRETNP